MLDTNRVLESGDTQFDNNVTDSLISLVNHHICIIILVTNEVYTNVVCA